MSDASQAMEAVRTFLIADIRGYTTFTREHGDEAASRLARKFAEVIREGVRAWDGRLVELRGDEALAVFESPRRALRAAVELQAAFAAETSQQPRLPLAVGIGLDAGEAVAVADGYRGAALNLAARLCAVARAGEVIASANLTHLAGPTEGLTYVPREAVPAKGFDQPIPAFAITARDGAEAPAWTGSLSSPGALPSELDPIVPLCGREAELDRLSWHARRARHGHGRTVAVSGPPGIGKTRLAAEVATRAHAEGMRVVYVPAGRSSAALPTIETAEGSTLIVIDDLDAAPAPFTEDVTELVSSAVDAPVLILLTHRQEAPPGLVSLVEKMTGPERRLRLGPLDATGVRAIAALYAGPAVDEVPLGQIVSESGGVPAAVHRVASHVVGAVTSQRLGASADRTRAGRQDLRAAEAELIDQVTGLELVRERARLFGAADDSDEDGPLPAICPYKGLESFEASDAEYYFGRERLVAELVARLVGTSFLGLVGASGSGKSSALRAGLLPALAGGVLPGSDGWPQVLMRPGEQPMRELSLALRRAGGDDAPDPGDDAPTALAGALSRLAPGQRLLLVVDQFEEIFSATRDETELADFVELLTGERAGLKVLVSLRADHYGRCAAHPALARAIGANHVLVGPLNSNELAAVIERPAQRVGLRVEPELTDALVEDVSAEPGALPLLSTSLLELWQARDGRRMTLAAYRATGGVQGAVARLAESAYQALDDDQRLVARSVFLRLAGPGEGEGVVRRRVPLAELDVEHDETVAGVVTALTDARLLTTGDGYVEVAHEALLREWPRVQQWLAEDAAGRELRLHLTAAAREWDSQGREPAELYRGARLAAALEWAAEHQHELNATERDFLEAGRAESEREIARQRRANRRLRVLLAGAGVFLVAAVAAGAYAVIEAGRAEEQAALADQQAQRAEAGERQAEREAEAAREAEQEALRQADRAEQANLLARSHELAAYSIAFLEDDPPLAKLLALSATTLVPNPPVETVSALHQAWAADRIVGSYSWPDDKDIDEQWWADLDPPGELIVAGGWRYIEVVERASGELVWSREVGEGLEQWQPVFAWDGEVVALGVYVHDDPAARRDTEATGMLLVDPRTGRQVAHFDLGPCGGGPWHYVSRTYALVEVLDGAPEGCWSNEEIEPTLQLLDMTTGERSLIAQAPFEASLSADGSRLAYESAPLWTTTVVDLASGAELFQLDSRTTEQGNAFIRELSPDGSLLLYGGRPVHVYDAATGELVGRYHGHAGEAFEVRFSRDGQTVYSSGRDGSLHHWWARGGDAIAVYRGLGTGWIGIADSGLLLVSDPNRQIAWQLETGVRGEMGAVAACVPPPDGLIYAHSLSVGGGNAAHAQTCERDAVSVVSDLATGETTMTLPGHNGQGLKLSPDGRRLLRQGGGFPIVGPPEIVDLGTGAILTLDGVCTYDIFAEEPRAEQAGCRAWPEMPFPLDNQYLAWSPDGRYVGIVEQGRDAAHSFAVWDATSGALLHVAPRDLFAHGLIFSPDSSRLIVAHAHGAPAPLLHYASPVQITVLSTMDWAVEREVPLPDLPILAESGVFFIGFSADGQWLIGLTGWAGTGGGSMVWFDAQTLQPTARVDRVHEGSPKTFAISPDASLIATGASDGYVRVWDVERRALVHEFRSPTERGQVQGVAFVDGKHLAVAPQRGHIYIYTIDETELIDLVRRSLTRGFTEFECERFNFGDSCPTLEELRGDAD